MTKFVTKDNPNGDIINSNLEMAANILGFVVREANMKLRWRHVGMCSNNTVTIS